MQAPGLRIALAGLASTAIAIGVGRFAFTPLLPMMQEDAGVSIADAGWLAAANYLGYLLGALVPVAVRMHAAVTIRAGLATIGAATIAMGYAESFASWMLLRVLAGVACAWVLIFVFAWCLQRLAPLRRPVLEAMVFAGVGAGIAVAGVACLLFMQAHMTSAQAWIWLGALSLVVTSAVWRTFSPEDGLAAEPGDAVPATWNADWARLLFCFGATGFGYIIPATFLPAMAKQAVGDPMLFGLSWPIFGLAVFASTLIAAVFARNLGGTRLWMICQLAMAAGVVLPLLHQGLSALVVSALLVGGTFMVVTLLAMQEARRVARPNPARLMAAMTAAFALGQVAGPLCVAFLARHGGDFAAASFAAGLLMLASAGVLLRRWSIERRSTR